MDPRAGEQHEEVRGIARLLVDPVFGSFFAAKLVSTIGIWIYNIVAVIVVFELSGSAFAVGLVTVAQFGPQLLLGPLAGSLADRRDRLKLVVAGRLIVAIGIGGLAAWTALSGPMGLPGTWPVIVASSVVGVGFALLAPAQHALLPAMVRPGELGSAVALNNVPPTLARACGPAVGALIAASTGPTMAFAVAAVLNLICAIAVAKLPVPVMQPISTPGRGVWAGVRYLQDDHTSALLIVAVAVVAFASDPAITLAPSLAVDVGGQAADVGILVTSFGIGAGAGFAVFAWLRRWLTMARLGATGFSILAFGMVATGLSPSLPVAVAGLSIAGVGMTVALTSYSTALQERLPDHLRGRVMALWSIAFLGTRPIAAAFHGGLTDATSPTVAFLVAASIVVGALWICRPTAIGVVD